MEEIYVSHDQKTLKDEYKKAAGKPVSEDFFIYTYHSELHSLENIKGDGSLKWSGLEKDHENLEEALIALFDWYKSECEDLSDNRPLDYALCSRTMEYFIPLLSDTALLVSKITGKALPDHRTQSEDTAWETVKNALKSAFPTTSKYLISCLVWQNTSQLKTETALKDLPPVGRHYLALRGNAKKSYDKTDKPSRGGRDRGRGDREAPDYKSSGRSHNRDRSDRGGRDRDRGDRGRGGRRDFDKKPRDRDEDPAKKEKERLAMLEVDKAVLTLKKHSSMKEFRLRPQNSFVRRLQHKKISGMGFQSHSVGEEQDRAVLIVRG